jgi:hypothetical protein
MGSRFVRPDTVQLRISQGDTLTVKRRLTAGEQRQLFARLVKSPTIDGTTTPEIQIDVAQAGLSTILAYLVDWSFPECAIRGASLDVVQAALDALDTDTYHEILAAITAHETAMAQEREQEKAHPFIGSAL